MLLNFNPLNAQTNYIAPTTTESFVASSSFWTAPTINVENTAIDVIEDPNNPHDFVAVRAWDGDKPGLQLEISALGYSEAFALNSILCAVSDPEVSIVPDVNNANLVLIVVAYEIFNGSDYDIYYRIAEKDITNTLPATPYTPETALANTANDERSPQMDYSLDGTIGAVLWRDFGTNTLISGTRFGFNGIIFETPGASIFPAYQTLSIPCSNTSIIRGFDVAISDEEDNLLPFEHQIFITIAGEDVFGNNAILVAEVDFGFSPLIISCSSYLVRQSYLSSTGTITQNCRIAAPENGFVIDPAALDCSIVYEAVNSGAGTREIIGLTRANGLWSDRVLNDINNLYNCFNEKPVVTYVRDNIITAWQSEYDLTCQVPPTPIFPFLDDLDIIVRQCNFSGTPLHSSYSVANDYFDGDQIIPSLAGRFMSNAGSASNTFYFWFDDHLSELSFKDRFYSSTSLKTSIDELEELNVKLYPNPVVDELYIQSDEAIEQVIVQDVNGIEISVSSDHFETIDFKSINPGVYFITIKTTNAKSRTFKIVK